MTDIETNKMAEDALTQMKEMSLTDFEKLVQKLPDKATKILLIKLIRMSE